MRLTGGTAIHSGWPLARGISENVPLGTETGTVPDSGIVHGDETVGQLTCRRWWRRPTIASLVPVSGRLVTARWRCRSL